MKINKLVGDITNILKNKTGMDEDHFFNVLVTYKMAQLATMMRANVSYVGGKNIPVNVYALNLADSGFSKGRSLNYLDDYIFNGFRQDFKELFEHVKTNSLMRLATQLAVKKKTDEEDEYNALLKEFNKLPKFMYSSGAATTEGLKGLMTALSMIGIGNINIEIDEIGNNLTGNADVLATLLETYDIGKTRNKLRRMDSQKDIEGKVPTNLMMFGTGSSLLDGANTESLFISFLETGYGRRLIYGEASKTKIRKKSALERFKELTESNDDEKSEEISEYFRGFAKEEHLNRELVLTKEANIKLLEYEERCIEEAEKFKEHQSIEFAEMRHRYFRVLKISGVYSFIMGENEVNEERIDEAIALVERSGESFKKITNREKPYVRLAKYLSEVDQPVTHADLIEDLPFYRGSESARSDMVSLAKAWGYNNSIIIKETVQNGIMFFKGEKLESTELDKIMCSYSKFTTEGYEPVVGKWEYYRDLLKSGYNYTAHHFKDKYRESSNAIPGFNLIVLDVDNGLPIDIARELLKDYTYMIGTTKSHTPEHNRYRILLPMAKKIKLEPEDYSKFMENVFDYIPFEVDVAGKDIARKWKGNPDAEVWENSGALIDPMMFIPNTDREKQTKKKISELSDFSKIEKWILMNTEGRNNALIKIGLMHLDHGKTLDEAIDLVYSANNKFDEPLSQKEIMNTILKTMTKHAHKGA